MKNIFLLLALVLTFNTHAQQFINSGTIEYEVRIGNHKMIKPGTVWGDIAIQNLPEFSTLYYSLAFADNKALYKFDRQNEKPKISLGFNQNNEDDIWYNDYTNNTYTNARYIIDDTYLLSGQLRDIEWKFVPNETREIAGFNCRKAYGIIYDSVYVFAFYTDEIMVTGGPMGIHGLPGMILGLTIPRMYASWIATKMQLAADTKKIVAPQKGKKKDPTELKTTVQKMNNNYLTEGQQTLWHYFL